MQVLREFVRLKMEADKSMDDMTQDIVLEGVEQLGEEWSVLIDRSCANGASPNATAEMMKTGLEDIVAELSSTRGASVVLGGQEIEGMEKVLPALCPFLNATNTTANMTNTVSEVRRYWLLLHSQNSGRSIPWMTICTPECSNCLPVWHL